MREDSELLRVTTCCCGRW